MASKGMSPLQVLELAMERERGGREFYLKAAATTRDGKGKQMFEWLARQEEGHLNRLTRQRDALASGGPWPRLAAGELGEPLRKVEFPKAAEARGKVEVVTGELEALKTGIQAEKDSVALYSEAARTSSQPGAKAMFEGLVKEEQGHLDLLEAEYEWLSKSKTYFTLHRFSLRPPGQA